MTWFKSSYSADQTACVEVACLPSAANWRKASYSASQTECVEVADWATGAAVRDTKHRELGALAFPTGEWQAFLGTAKR